MVNFDFFGARNKHLEWKSKLQAYFKTGTGLTSSQVTSEHECDLGKWIDGDGLKKYGSIPEMRKLDSTHKSLHATVRAAVVAKESNNMTVANAELEKVGTLSNEIVRLLNAVEAATKKLATAAT